MKYGEIAENESINAANLYTESSTVAAMLAVNGGVTVESVSRGLVRD